VTSVVQIGQGAMTHRPHHLEIAVEGGQDAPLVLVLRGDIDLQTSSKLRDRLEEAILEGASVVLDLHDVHFVDSPGLGTIIYCHRLLHEHGLELAVRAPQPQVRELFDVVQLGCVIDIV
jgi:anti-sigma B factor antagonist